MKIFKIGQIFIYRDSSRVRQNKSGEVWSSNLGDLDVKSYPPKALFSEDHIFTRRKYTFVCGPGLCYPWNFTSLNLSPVGLRAPGGLALGFAPNIYFFLFWRLKN